MEAKLKFTLGHKDAKKLMAHGLPAATNDQPQDKRGFIEKQAYNQQYKAQSVNPKAPQGWDMGPVSRMAMRKLGEPGLKGKGF